MPKNYYETLDIPKDASEEQIKKAYRQLALKYHPDRAPEDKKKEYEEKFKEISHAYQVLSNKEKRTQYDQFGQTFEGGSSGGGFSQQDFGSFYDAFGGQDSFENMGFGRIFEEVFGFRQRGKPTTEYGQDIYLDLEIDLKEAFHGLEKEFDLPKMITCQKCQGIGGESLKKCSICGGSGYEQERTQSILGLLLRQKPCSQCGGRGEKPEKTCSDCRGDGRIRERKTIKINVPAGIDNGQTLKLSGQGEAAPHGGQAGDLLVNIHIRPRQNLKRQEENLYCELPINFTQAALGDKIKIEGIDGEIKLKIPSGIQPGEMIRLKGQGMPRLYGRGNGDMIVKIQVVIPKKISRQQKKLIEELSATN